MMGETAKPPTMIDSPRSGAVLFAADPDRVADFYKATLGLGEHTATAIIVLESAGFQLVVHRIVNSGVVHYAGQHGHRANAAFKPIFFVAGIARLRSVAEAHGGPIEPAGRSGCSTVRGCATGLIRKVMSFNFASISGRGDSGALDRPSSRRGPWDCRHLRAFGFGARVAWGLDGTFLIVASRCSLCVHPQEQRTGRGGLSRSWPAKH